MSEYFPGPKSLGKVKVELDLRNYASKTDLKDATGIDPSSFAKKVDLAHLKSNVDKLDIDKLKNIPTNLNNLKNKVDKLDVNKLIPVAVDLSKLSDLVKNVVKKDVYNANIKNIEDKIPDITNLTTRTTLNAKKMRLKVKYIILLTCLLLVLLLLLKIKYLLLVILSKKTDYNTKINEIEKKITDHNHDNHFTTPEVNKLTSENFVARLKQANLASKIDIANFINKTDFDNKLSSFNTK